MALVINTNLSSLKAQINLDKTQLSLSTSLQRISTGLRINSPKDDAAGLAVSQRLSSQIGRLKAAVKNANDGVAFIQSADSALRGIVAKLEEIQGLASEAVNGSIDATVRGVLQKQVIAANETIGQLADQAKFKGQKVLTGKIVNAEFQVGLLADESIRVTMPRIIAENLGNYSIRSDNTRDFAIGAARIGDEQGVAQRNFTQQQTLTIRGFSSSQAGSQVAVEEGETAKSIAEKINATEPLTGVSAVASSYLTMEDIYDTASAGIQKISFRLYGVNEKDLNADDPTASAESISALVKDGTEESLQDLVSVINAKTSTTGIRAKAFTEVIDGQNKIKIALSNGGSDISIEGFRNDLEGTTARVGVAEMIVRGFAGTDGAILGAGTAQDSVTVGGTVALNSARTFTATSNVDETSSLFFSGVDEIPQTAKFDSLASADLSTDESAKKTLLSAASALDFISSLQGEFGAIQSRFEATILNIVATQENTEAAKSRILDADFAQETANLTRAQVLQQAGIAILAQANSTPQAVLALLRT